MCRSTYRSKQELKHVVEWKTFTWLVTLQQVKPISNPQDRMLYDLNRHTRTAICFLFWLQVTLFDPFLKLHQAICRLFLWSFPLEISGKLLILLAKKLYENDDWATAPEAEMWGMK